MNDVKYDVDQSKYIYSCDLADLDKYMYNMYKQFN